MTELARRLHLTALYIKKLLFHITEAMSWESVRNLNHMKNTFVLVKSIAQQINVSDEIMDYHSRPDRFYNLVQPAFLLYIEPFTLIINAKF